MKLTADIEKSNTLGVYTAEVTMEDLPPLTVFRQKADRSDLEYEIRRAFAELVEEIVTAQLKSEF